MSTNNYPINQGVWFCLHFPQLPIEVFDREQNNKRPVVVLERQRVVFMNSAAKKMGIREGSNMNTAYTISEKVVSFDRDEEKELATLAHLAQWAYQFTPNVSIKAPHSLLLDVEGCLKLFSGIDNLKSKIVDGLTNLGFNVVMGINRTPLSALLFAESEKMEVNPSNHVKQSVSDIPIHFLRADDGIIENLQQMGIVSVKQLLDLPIDGLNRRFGVFFTDYLQRLTGEVPDPQMYVGDKPRFMSDVTFLSDVTNIESLVFPIKRLLGELQDFLRCRQLLINQFSFTLSHRSHSPRSFSVYLANPDNDAAMFLMLSQLQLEKIDDIPEVDNISLSAKTFFEAETSSGDLFHGTRFKQKDGRIHSKAGEANAVRLLNMLTARLGRQSCFGISLENDHRPERAWKTVQLANKDYWNPETAEPNTRPVYLLPTPKQLGCDSNEPYMSGKLELMQGPERIDFGWWDNQNISRDYYVCRHECGALYWIYLDRDDKKDDRNWYLHGIFS